MFHLLQASAGTLARVCALPATVLFVVSCGWMTERLMRKRPLPPHAIDSSTYRVPATHIVHVVDFDRSCISICEDGTILARCCMQGCDTTVKIGRDIIGLIVSAELADRPAERG